MGYGEIFDHIIKQISFKEIDAKPMME